MTTSVKPIPEGYHTLTPYLMISGATEAIEFYKQAFNAVERYRLPTSDGKQIGHAELMIGDSIIMLADDCPEATARSPHTLGGTCCGFVLYVADVDKLFPQAIAAGATVVQPLENKFYGDRMGTLLDPFGHQWSLGTHIEDVSPAEMEQRAAQAMAAKSDAA